MLEKMRFAAYIPISISYIIHFECVCVNWVVSSVCDTGVFIS